MFDRLDREVRFDWPDGILASAGESETAGGISRDVIVDVRQDMPDNTVQITVNLRRADRTCSWCPSEEPHCCSDSFLRIGRWMKYGEW